VGPVAAVGPRDPGQMVQTHSMPIWTSMLGVGVDLCVTWNVSRDAWRMGEVCPGDVVKRQSGRKRSMLSHLEQGDKS